MNKKRNILGFLQSLPVLLMFSAASADVAEKVDPLIERIVGRDLGLYQTGEQRNINDLAAEIHALREELHQTHEHQDNRLQRIEGLLKLTAGKQVAQQLLPAAEPVPAGLPNGSGKISVCSSGCDFNDLQKAVDAAMPGGEINVAPEINGTCAVIGKSLRIVGKRGTDGRRAHLAGGVCAGKAPLVTAAGNIVIEGFEISGIAVGDGNGACLRLDPGTRDLTVRDIYCHDSQDGILGSSDGQMLIEDSIFIGNGFGEGQAHGLYVWGGEVLIRHSQILSTQNAGHSLKFGVRKLTIEDSIIAALNGRNSRALDAFAGGEVVLRRNVIQQGPQSDNSDVIGLALEAGRLLPEGHSLRLENNWVIYDGSSRGILIRGQKLGPITLQNNTFVGLSGVGIDGVQDNGNRWLATRKQAGLPVFDGTLSSLPTSAAKQ